MNHDEMHKKLDGRWKDKPLKEMTEEELLEEYRRYKSRKISDKPLMEKMFSILEFEEKRK